MAEQLDPAVEQQLADMSDQDWRSLSARVRPPTSSEQLTNVAAQHLSPEHLSTFMAIADPKKLADEHGNVDPAKVQQASTLFGPRKPQQQRQWGQHSGSGGPGKQLGDDGRAALEKRHGVKSSTDAPAAGAQIPAGQEGRAELAKRYGRTTK